MEIKNKLTVTTGEAGGDNRGKKGKGQAKGCEQKTHEHGKWGDIDCGSWGNGIGESKGEKGGTTVTEQQ